MPVYELMRKDKRVTVLAVNKTGGINEQFLLIREKLEKFWNSMEYPVQKHIW